MMTKAGVENDRELESVAKILRRMVMAMAIMQPVAIWIGGTGVRVCVVMSVYVRHWGY